MSEKEREQKSVRERGWLYESEMEREEIMTDKLRNIMKNWSILVFHVNKIKKNFRRCSLTMVITSKNDRSNHWQSYKNTWVFGHDKVLYYQGQTFYCNIELLSLFTMNCLFPICCWIKFIFWKYLRTNISIWQEMK